MKRLQSFHGETIDNAIEQWLRERPSVGSFYDMMRYQMGYVDERLRAPGSAGGKRFRPLLCLLACEAVGGEPRNALPIACAIELIHNFSLIHDDIEDRDPERRHRPSVWKVWGEPQAINVGDGMFALAARIALESTYDTALALELARGFQDTVLGLTEGQYLDMSFESRVQVSPEEYLEMITLKTSILIAYSLWSGARIGGASQEEANRLYGFGIDLGRAFQIRDDILGIWGAPQATGKQAANDVRTRKKTLPVLLAMSSHRERDRRTLEEYYTEKNDNVDDVLRVLSATEAQRLARDRAHHFREAALTFLDNSGLTNQARRDFRELANELTT